MNYSITPITQEDGQAIVDIFNHYVEDSSCFSTVSL